MCEFRHTFFFYEWLSFCLGYEKCQFWWFTCGTLHACTHRNNHKRTFKLKCVFTRSIIVSRENPLDKHNVASVNNKSNPFARAKTKKYVQINVHFLHLLSWFWAKSYYRKVFDVYINKLQKGSKDMKQKGQQQQQHIAFVWCVLGKNGQQWNELCHSAYQLFVVGEVALACCPFHFISRVLLIHLRTSYIEWKVECEFYIKS